MARTAFTTVAVAIAISATSAAAQITCNGSSCDPAGGSSGAYTSNRVENAVDVQNRLMAMGYSEADARAAANNYAAQHLDNRNTATGGNAVAQGGSAAQRQIATGGAQRQRSGDVSNIITGDEAAASSAIAPTVIHGNASECYWTFTITGAAQSTTGGGSAGAGLFPIRLETCMRFKLAEMYANGAGQNPEALRLMREIEASFD